MSNKNFTIELKYNDDTLVYNGSWHVLKNKCAIPLVMYKNNNRIGYREKGGKKYYGKKKMDRLSIKSIDKFIPICKGLPL